MSHQLRPPAIPLVTVDPFFSIWSCVDELHQDKTRHWTLTPHELIGLVRVDGTVFRFLGSTNDGPAWRNARQLSGMRQVEVQVRPTRTIYRFEDAGIELTLTFVAPLLPDDFDLLSRPYSYVSMAVRSQDGVDHSVQLYLEASPGIACANREEPIVWEQSGLGDGWTTMRAGTWQQNRLGHRGDLTTIEWGYIHLMGGAESESRIAPASELRSAFTSGGGIRGESTPCSRKGRSLAAGAPSLALTWDLGSVSSGVECLGVLGYEDEVSIDYFGTPRPAYCFRNGRGFRELALDAIVEWPAIRERCVAFDERLLADAEASGGSAFADLVGLAYRQSIAAHKLIADEEGQAIFLSKECTSNGSIGTVDVSYPSTPLYLLLAPDLVAGMLRPVFRFAESDAWPAPYAPHDVGTYPRATGQTYGMIIDRIELSGQMPVEECGNMLIMTAAHAALAGSTELAERYWTLLSGWTDYLVEHGLDPENQLCTDDFAGHLARNTNLSIKAIMGIASFARLCEATGKDDPERYMGIARDYATKWQSMAKEGDHYRLTFDGEGTWSLKYNLIWDRFFGFDLFPPEVAEQEVSHYLKQADTYGVPLDSRSAFTKTDWLVWAACLTTDRKIRDRFVECVWTFANGTMDRTPFSDWYDTHDGREQSFHNRTVIGGIFMPLLMDTHARNQGR